VILLVVGIVLVVAGAVGGLAPNVKGALRAGAAAAGLLCIVAGVIILSADSPAIDQGGVKAVIRDKLASDQIEEEIKIVLDGRDVGVLTANKRKPIARMTVRVPKVGEYPYRIEVSGHAAGRPATQLSGSGKVRIDGTGELRIVGDGEGHVYLAPAPS
jgi:hypothetical protein